MKKLLPYFLGFIAVVAVIALVFSAPKSRQKKLDERITFKQKDKIPYGTFAASEFLPAIFPFASISTDKKDPGNWEGITNNATNQAVIITAKNFDPELYELKRLADFIHHGNYVFIITKSLSYDAANYFGINDNERFFYMTSEDSLEVKLNEKYFTDHASFIYPGKKFDSYFTSVDSSKTLCLGTDLNGSANFVQLQAGNGKLFIHLAPMAFTNYFILHKNNVQYFQKALSVIPSSVNKVLWNEFYLTNHKEQKEEEPSVLRVLWQYPSFRWSLITIIVTLLVYVLLEMRRRQRLILVWKKPSNDSLDFVRTMGRLYYDKKDHHNLARKMSAHFLDYLRNRYQVNTKVFEKPFVADVHFKTGYAADKIEAIVDSMSMVQQGIVTEEQLVTYYHQLEAFYKNT